MKLLRNGLCLLSGVSKIPVSLGTFQLVCCQENNGKSNMNTGKILGFLQHCSANQSSPNDIGSVGSKDHILSYMLKQLFLSNKQYELSS